MSTTILENQLLDNALKDSGEGLELAIKSMQQLTLLDSVEQYPNIFPNEEIVQNNLSASSSSNFTPLLSEWVDLSAKEMTNAASLDNDRARTFRALEAFENKKTGTLTLKNLILKRAVVIQHQRLIEKQREMEDLKKNLLEHQEKMRILELKNYALVMHLRQAENDAASGGYHWTDIF